MDFLKAESAKDIESNRRMWRSVAAQLRNRTMPPMASKLSEDDRLQIAAWVEERLRQTACSAGEFAGSVPPRRLNRREYRNTIRDLLGVDLNVSEIFPADESAGAGFDTFGESLYIPPMLVERYMEAANRVLDRVIVTRPLQRLIRSTDMEPRIPENPGKPGRTLAPGDEFSFDLPIFVEGDYDLRFNIERPVRQPFELELKIDGVSRAKLDYRRDLNGGSTTRGYRATLDRGVHRITIGAAPDYTVHLFRFIVEQAPPDAPPDKNVLHYRLFGLEPGEYPVDARAAARGILANFLPKAFRRPVEPSEIERFLALYDRAAERGDPYEERIKLALKAVLVSPHFLFRVENRATTPGIRPIGQYEIASRLSYFLWSTMPDAELMSLARQGRLQDPEVLRRQVARMLDDPRSRAFASAFIGQWLGTQEIGGRVVPLLTELQNYYTPDVAADLRQEPALLMHYIVSENRSLLDLLDGNYTFMTERLARYYQVEGKVQGLDGDTFRRVEWPDNRRGGILGFASVLAMTSHYKEPSPVLRGAWVLEKLLGTPIPSPPPDVPALDQSAKEEAKLTLREMLERHRADPSCNTCHNLMDPIGFGLENFDWMGRWREVDLHGKPIDASGTLPSGESFNGPLELRKVLMNRKDDFVYHLTGKVLGYALGRSLQDGDQCTIQRISEALKQENYSARILIREIVLSTPFRNSQSEAASVPIEPAAPKQAPRRLLGIK